MVGEAGQAAQAGQAGEDAPERVAAGQGDTVRATRTRDEVVLRVPTFGRLLRAVLPEAAVQHLYAAQREQLLAARAVIDAAVERLEKAQQAAASAAPRRTEINVE
jgi:hypothetical protein